MPVKSFKEIQQVKGHGDVCVTNAYLFSNVKNHTTAAAY
jgi:hypothetical protein